MLFIDTSKDLDEMHFVRSSEHAWCPSDTSSFSLSRYFILSYPSLRPSFPPTPATLYADEGVPPNERVVCLIPLRIELRDETGKAGSHFGKEWNPALCRFKFISRDLPVFILTTSLLRLRRYFDINNLKKIAGFRNKYSNLEMRWKKTLVKKIFNELCGLKL